MLLKITTFYGKITARIRNVLMGFKSNNNVSNTDVYLSWLASSKVKESKICNLHNITIWVAEELNCSSKFWIYFSMMATCIVQPLDLIKTRMQLAGMGKSSVAVTSEIVAMEGFMALYNGLSAGLLRQATYGTTRLGVFNYLFDSYKEQVSMSSTSSAL